jgi:hypothetical protein
LNGEHFYCPKCKADEENNLRERIAALEKEREVSATAAAMSAVIADTAAISI